MNREGRVAEHRFRPGRRHNDELIGVLSRISDVPEVAFRFRVVNLFVADRRVILRAPIDDVAPAID